MQAEMRVILEKLKGIQEENEQQKQQFQEDGASSGCAEFTLSQYSKMRDSGGSTIFAPFYTHPHGYKLRLKIGSYNDEYINVRIHGESEYDDELLWPANIKGYLNQAGDDMRLRTIMHTKLCAYYTRTLVLLVSASTAEKDSDATHL